MQKHFNIYMKWTTLLSVIGLCGCSSTAFREDTTNYPKVYAEASDDQLLLNLARVSKDEPVYFLQLGSISAQHSYTASLSWDPTYTVRNTPFTPFDKGSGIAASGTVTPTFQFLPISGSNYVQAVLLPISPAVPFRLYDQGYEADLLARIMVASIQYNDLNPIRTNPIPYIEYRTNIEYQIITNANYQIKRQTNIEQRVKWQTNIEYQTNYEFWVNDPNDPTYPKFLEFCNNLRNAQLDHLLIFQQQNSNTVIYSGSNTSLTDVVSASQQPGLSITCNDTNTGHIIVQQAEQTPGLVYYPADTNYQPYPPWYCTNAITTNITAIIPRSADKTNLTIDKLALTYDTENSTEKFNAAKNLAANYQSYTLKMRTFEAIMYTVAKQEVYFERMERRPQPKPCPCVSTNIPTITFTNDAYGYCAIVCRPNGSQFSVRPLMTLTYKRYDEIDKAPHLSDARANKPTVSIAHDDNNLPFEPADFIEQAHIDYDGVRYVVGDLKGANQNKTVFTIITYLFAQTAINTQNLPIQQFIQVP